MKNGQKDYLDMKLKYYKRGTFDEENQCQNSFPNIH